MELINPFKTYRNYLKWKKIILLNNEELKQRGFLHNWIYQLGLIIELDEVELQDVEHIYNPLQRDFLIDDIIKKKMREVLNKHNSLFLEQGLLELIDDDFVIEKSVIKKYTYYITLSFEISRFSRLTSNIMIILSSGLLLFLLYHLYKTFA